MTLIKHLSYGNQLHMAFKLKLGKTTLLISISLQGNVKFHLVEFRVWAYIHTAPRYGYCL